MVTTPKTKLHVAMQYGGLSKIRSPAVVKIILTTDGRVPPGPYKSLKMLKCHTFKYKALKSP